MRYALVTLTWERDNPEPYMPGNYQVLYVRPHPDTPPVGITTGPRDGWRQALIAGDDNAGWTLDEYVIPRLASGGMYATEVTAEVAKEVICHDLPRYEHDCESCLYLGREGKYDLYYCPTGPTVVARSSSEGGDYLSGLSFVGRSAPLTEAFRRAEQLGLVSDEAREEVNER
jgi:hypothetical protein